MRLVNAIHNLFQLFYLVGLPISLVCRRVHNGPDSIYVISVVSSKCIISQEKNLQKRVNRLVTKLNMLCLIIIIVLPFQFKN